ncbi:MAG TPA: YCF48-related protein [Bacteroidia bacterium]|nr:YCF48-related protein [Bacteroidia bacterium]
MKLKKIIIGALFIFAIKPVYSQWTQLTVPPPEDFNIINPCPVSNGKIYFGVVFGHSAMSIQLYHSNYDMSDHNFDRGVYNGGSSPGYSPFTNISYANDSTVCYSSLYNLTFTFNSFVNSQMTSASTMQGNQFIGRNWPLAITSKFFYYFTQYSNSASSDTSFITRTDMSLVKSVFKLPLCRIANGSHALKFLNDSVGFFLVVNKNNLSKTSLIKTVNYGQNWAYMITDSVNEINDYSFPSASTGYLTKKNGSIHKTTDGGTTWNQIALITPSLNCIKFANDTLGYIGGINGLLWKTIDGGLSWQSEVSNTPYSINSIHTFGEVAYFVNGLHNVFKNGPLVVGLEKQSLDATSISVFPNPASEEVTIDMSSHSENLVCISLVNIFGEKVFEETSPNLLKNNIYKIPVKNMSHGVYFILGQTKSGSFRKKIIVGI